MDREPQFPTSPPIWNYITWESHKKSVHKWEAAYGAWQRRNKARLVAAGVLVHGRINHETLRGLLRDHDRWADDGGCN